MKSCINPNDSLLEVQTKIKKLENTPNRTEQQNADLTALKSRETEISTAGKTGSHTIRIY